MSVNQRCGKVLCWRVKSTTSQPISDMRHCMLICWQFNMFVSCLRKHPGHLNVQYVIFCHYGSLSQNNSRTWSNVVIAGSFSWLCSHSVHHSGVFHREPNYPQIIPLLNIWTRWLKLVKTLNKAVWCYKSMVLHLLMYAHLYSLYMILIWSATATKWHRWYPWLKLQILWVWT